MKVCDCISIIAVILAPIIAVWVGQKLQERELKRRDKMQVFKTLMAERAFRTQESTLAYNIIEIVFADDEAVISQWKKYYDKLCVDSPTEADLKKMNDEGNKLLEVMAHSLGYRNIKWDTIQNPYLPKGVVDEMNNRLRMQNAQQATLETIVKAFEANETK